MEVSSIAEQLCFTSVRVETVDASGNKGIATSFIFNYKSENKQYPSLVTNKHVISGTDKGRLTFIQARHGKPLLGTGFRLDIEHFEEIWHGHHSVNIDVAVTPFASLVDHIKKAGTNIYFRTLERSLYLQKTI